MPKIIIPSEIKDYATIIIGDCTHPAGHCYGSDGGSGIPDNLKVPTGQGGEFEVWKLSPDKQTLLEDAYYNRCQYCQKFTFIETKADRDAKTI